VPEVVAVIDADDDLSEGAALDNLIQHDPHTAIRGILEFSPALVFNMHIIQSLPEVVVNYINDFRILIEDFRNGLILCVILIGNLKVRGLKIEFGLVINVGTQVGPPFAYWPMVDQILTVKYANRGGPVFYNVANLPLF